MPPDTITLTAEVTPDHFDVVDGRAIVRAMTWQLLPVLLPYVGGCQHCAAELLVTLTRENLARARRERPEPAAVLMGRRAYEMSGAECEARHRLHLEVTKYETRGLLRRLACPHDDEGQRYGERRPEPADADQPGEG